MSPPRLYFFSSWLPSAQPSALCPTPLRCAAPQGLNSKPGAKLFTHHKAWLRTGVCLGGASGALWRTCRGASPPVGGDSCPVPPLPSSPSAPSPTQYASPPVPCSTFRFPFPVPFPWQVVALRSQQLKAEQAYSQAEAAEAKLAEAGQQLASLSAQLSTETARAQQLAGEISNAKEAEKVCVSVLGFFSGVCFLTGAG